MEIVRAFTTNKLHTEIVIKGTYEEPLFRANDIGEVLQMTNIRATIQTFDETEKVIHNLDTIGGSQQLTFLTEKGLYKVLFKSRKQIAQIFQNWVCEVIKEIRLSGVYTLKKQLEEKDIEVEAKVALEKELEKERLLLSEYSNAGSMVYVIKVKDYLDKTYVVKIGESRKGITERYNEHKSKFKDILLLNCFSVDKSKEFESFLHHHPTIYPNKCKTLVGHERENELFLVGTNLTYQILLKVIEDNIAHYNYRVSELLLENQLLKKARTETYQGNADNELIAQLLETNKSLLNKITLLEQCQHQIFDALCKKDTTLVTGFGQQMPTLGPRLQKINPENMQLVHIYESVTEAMNHDKNIKRPSIMKAIKENTVYCGFRWQLVERNNDASIVHSIEPTKETKVQSLGYIAKLDSLKSTILNVYLDRKTAAKFNEYKSLAALDNPVKHGTITNGYFYMLYSDCDGNLTSEFESKHGYPLLYKNGVGQFDVNGNRTHEFACKYDCIKELKMSDKTLSKCLNENVAYNGYFYKELGSKLKLL